ncbi:MAG: hypothetical protein LBV02_00470 [Bacteroidales bacterium]|jgi:hypothetical protein|nr:hypothetical protein [Bacteroidales bacterium]
MMKRSILLIFTVLFTLSACNKPKVIVEKRYVFPENNWNNEERIVTYKATIDESPNPHKIVMELEHLHKEAISFPLTMTIKSPDGGTTSRRVNLFIGDDRQADPALAVVEIYPQKYFNTSGEYEFTVLRKWEKYDFYDNKALTLKIVKMPEEE